MTARKTFALIALAAVVGTAAWLRLPGTPAITPAEAATAMPGLQDLVGGTATAGEAAFRARGHVLARWRGLDSFWWHGAQGQCVRSQTERGIYRSIAPARAADCGM